MRGKEVELYDYLDKSQHISQKVLVSKSGMKSTLLHLNFILKGFLVREENQIKFYQKNTQQVTSLIMMLFGNFDTI